MAAPARTCAYALSAALAEPLQQHVAAEGDADQAHAHRRLARDQPAEHGVEVGRLPRVVEPRGAIRLTAARAKVQDHRPQAERRGLPAEARHVVRARGAFEPVEDDDDRRARRFGLAPVEVEEVAVGSIHALAAKARPADRPKQWPPQRLEMAAAIPPRPDIAVRRGHGLRGESEGARAAPSRRAYSWPSRSNAATAGAISRAR